MEDVLEIFTADGLIHNEEGRERAREGLEKNAREPEWYDHYLVAEGDGKVVGRVILEAAYPPYSELVNLYVLPEYQRIGVGSCLVQSCVKTATTSKSFVMSVMTDPVENLPAHRLYSKFSFRPGIIGDPSSERGHMWLFRFSEESCVSEFLTRHPFAEPEVSRSRVHFHDRMLYRMSWPDPQTKDGMDLFIEGQPSQTLEGTMPRIAGLSYQEGDTNLELSAMEKDDSISEGRGSGFTVGIRNKAPHPFSYHHLLQSPTGQHLPLGHHLHCQSMQMMRSRLISNSTGFPDTNSQITHLSLQYLQPFISE